VYNQKSSVEGEEVGMTLHW